MGPTTALIAKAGLGNSSPPFFTTPSRFPSMSNSTFTGLVGLLGEVIQILIPKSSNLLATIYFSNCSVYS